MRFYLLFFILLTNLNLFSQKSEKDYLLEIIQLEQRNRKLVFDSIQIFQKVHNFKRWNSYELEKQKWINDSLRFEIKKLQKEKAKLDSLKREIMTLSDSTVILYRDEKREVCYINLSAYEITLKQNDVIILKPISDKSKWRPPLIDGYPKPRNLSLHLYPHKFDGDKLYLQP